MRGIARRLVRPSQGIAEVHMRCLRRICKWQQNPKRPLRIALLQMSISGSNRCVCLEDAVWMLLREVIEEGIRVRAVPCLYRCLRSEVIGIVVQSNSARVSPAIGLCRIGVAVIQHVSVTQRKISCSGALPGMHPRIIFHPAVGRCRARHRQLLRHGTRLGRSLEHAGQPNRLRGRPMRNRVRLASQ